MNSSIHTYPIHCGKNATLWERRLKKMNYKPCVLILHQSLTPGVFQWAFSSESNIGQRLEDAIASNLLIDVLLK